MNRLAKTAWHRKASKPVTVWMAALVLISLVHWALPNYRWVLIHMFTLGIVTNSIMLWSQHFTEKFLHRQLPEETRPWQLRRFAILNVGILLIITGQLTKDMFAQHWHITAVGATVVGGSLAFHAGYLGRQYLQAKRGQRYAPGVIAYICSACCLPLGALAGAALAAGFPNPWQERLLLTHLILNILGFVGFAAIGSLMLLFPAIWRTQAHYERAPLTFALMSIGLTTAAGGALFGQGLIVAGGLVAYLIGIIIPIMSWGACVVTVLRDPRDRVTFAAVSVAAAPLWLCGTLIVLAYRAAIDLGTTAISLPTMPFLIGFAAQLLIGVMSNILPSNIGGGPKATRTGMLVYDRAGLFRATLVNVGLACWLYTENSWLRVVLSILAMGSLAVFLVLTPFAVRAQLGVIRKTREPLPLAEKPKTNQITAALAVLALVIASFGGLVDGGSGGSSGVVTAGGTGKTTEVALDMKGLRFSPDVITVPAGNQLVLTVHNSDTMAHDLKFDNGAHTGRMNPGEQKRLEVGVISADMAGWCTIAGHRAQGMEMTVKADTSGGSGSSSSGSNGSNGGGADTAKPTSAHKPTHPIQNGTDDSLEPITER